MKKLFALILVFMLIACLFACSNTKFSISFNLNSAGDNYSLSFEEGSLLSGVETPKKEGYDFVGWTLVKDDISTIVDLQTYTVNSEATLFAFWTSSGVVLNYNLINEDSEYEVSGYKAIIQKDSYNLVIPQSYNGLPVTKVAHEAFKNFTKLSSLTIAESVKSIGRDIIKNCSAIKMLTLPFIGASPNQTTDAHLGYLFGIESPDNQNEDIPSSLEQVNITKATALNDYAFYGMEQLKRISLPSGLATIGNYTFTRCLSLESVELPLGLISIGSYAFHRATSLTQIIIPDSVTTISENAFSECTDLSSLFIPKNVRIIEDLAFMGCSKLKEVEVDAQNNNFKAIEGVLFTKDGKQLLFYPEARMGESYVIPSSVEKLSMSAFYGASNIKSLTISPNIVDIKMATFAYVNVEHMILPNGIQTIEDLAFRNCEKLISITLPSSITRIDYLVFYDCLKLEAIYYQGSAEDFAKVDVNPYTLEQIAELIRFS